MGEIEIQEVSEKYLRIVLVFYTGIKPIHVLIYITLEKTILRERGCVDQFIFINLDDIVVEPNFWLKIKPIGYLFNFQSKITNAQTAQIL